MKFKKFSTLILTTIMMLLFTVVGYAATSANITVSPKEGSTVKPGDTIEVTSILMEDSVQCKSKGFTSMSIYLYDGETNALIDSKSNFITDTRLGNNPCYSEIIVPSNCTSRSIIVKMVGGEKDGGSFTKSFKFNGPKISEGNNGNVLTITADKASGSTINNGDKVVFTTKSSNEYVGTRNCLVRIFNDETNASVFEKSNDASNQVVGANPLYYTKKMDFGPGRYRVEITSTDINGTVAKKTFYYTIAGESQGSSTSKDPEDEDEEEYEGIINKELDGLAIDLWLREDTRFYEYDKDDIPFVAFYYNADKKEAKKVTIEVEVPDGFKVVSKDALGNGTVTVKNDIIKYNIGTVPSKELRKVYFTLRAIDDDVCEEATNVVAVILKDDDEEDQSTQRVWIYEEGEKGSHNAYVTGYPDGTFRPDDNITREEVAAMMARAFNHTAINTTKSFSDVKKTSWSYNYIMACTTKGIITGYTNGVFKPFNSITRAELYAMTYRAMDIPTEEKALFVPKAYKNAESWEMNYIAGLTRLKMVKDMKDTDADEEATRAEVVYLINGVQFRNPSKMLDVEYSDLTTRHWASKHIAAASCNYTFKRGEDGKEIMTKK